MKKCKADLDGGCDETHLFFAKAPFKHTWSRGCVMTACLIFSASSTAGVITLQVFVPNDKCNIYFVKIFCKGLQESKTNRIN